MLRWRVCPLCLPSNHGLGMVAACAGADALHQWAAAVVGIGAGVSYYVLAVVVVRARIDDPLDAAAGKPAGAGGGRVIGCSAYGWWIVGCTRYARPHDRWTG